VVAASESGMLLVRAIIRASWLLMIGSTSVTRGPPSTFDEACHARRSKCSTAQPLVE
jgi:hypothetical protein